MITIKLHSIRRFVIVIFPFFSWKLFNIGQKFSSSRADLQKDIVSYIDMSFCSFCYLWVPILSKRS